LAVWLGKAKCRLSALGEGRVRRKSLEYAATALVLVGLIVLVAFVGPRLVPLAPGDDRVGGPPSPSESPAPSPSAARTLAASCVDPAAPSDPVVFRNPDGPAGGEPADGYQFFELLRALPTFGGIWVDEFRHQLHIALTCDIDSVRDQIGAQISRDTTVYFHLVPYSYAELESTRDGMFDDREALLAEGIYLSYGAVDERGNRVEIGIDPLTEAVVDEMRRRYGSSIEFFHAQRPLPTPSIWPTGPETLIAVRASTDGERMVTCGGPPFPASVLDQPDVEDIPADLVEHVHAAAEFWAIEFPGAAGLRWRLIHRDDQSAAFIARQGEGWIDLGLQRDAGGWAPAGIGQCRPHAVLDGSGHASWALDPAYPAPGPDATELHVLVTEGNCAGGIPAYGRISPPVVAYGPDSLTMTVGVQPVSGGATCPSNPPTPATVILPEPLGDRDLLDGGREPPAPPTSEY
jgi:hypothetical protein